MSGSREGVSSLDSPKRQTLLAAPAEPGGLPRQLGTLEPGDNGRGGGRSRLETELGYGLPVGSRLIGTLRVGIGASETGRAYRLGYGLTVAQGGALHVELGGVDTGVLGRAALGW